MADLLSDNFNRADAGSWGTASGGGAWTAINSGSSILSNQGKIIGSAAQIRGNTHAITITGKAVITWDTPSWWGTNSNDLMWVMTKANGGNRDGYGAEIVGSGTNNVVVRDSTTFPLGQGTFAFSAGTNYSFEMDQNANGSGSIFIWATSGSKGAALFSWSAGTRTGAGSLFVVGMNGDGADSPVMLIDNLLVTDGVASVNSGFFALM